MQEGKQEVIIVVFLVKLCRKSTTCIVPLKCRLFNPFMPNGFFYNHSLDWSISNIRGVWLVFIIAMFYLPMSDLWDTRLK